MSDKPESPSPTELGALVRRLRLQQGLSVDAFAKRAGLSTADVERLEAGDGEFDIEELFATGRGLGMEVSTLFRIWETQTSVGDLASHVD